MPFSFFKGIDFGKPECPIDGLTWPANHQPYLVLLNEREEGMHCSLHTGS